MKVTDPQPFLDAIDWKKFEEIRGIENLPQGTIEYTEPSPFKSPSIIHSYSSGDSALPKTISGRVQRFGDNIDTDSVCH